MDAENEISRLKSTDEAAELLGMSPHALRRWRREGRGPAFVKLSRAVKYEVRELLIFVEANKIRPNKR
jgi:hypothetical protein